MIRDRLHNQNLSGSFTNKVLGGEGEFHQPCWEGASTVASKKPIENHQLLLAPPLKPETQQCCDDAPRTSRTRFIVFIRCLTGILIVVYCDPHITG